MNAKKLLRKWTRRIERNDVGDDAGIRQTLEAAGEDIQRWRASLRTIEFVELSCKLWALAVIRKHPNFPSDLLEAGMLRIYEQLVPRCN